MNKEQMTKYQEFDLRKSAKSNAEYITPQKLREFLKGKIEKKDITILEPALGSGQLLFELQGHIKEVDGFDINQEALDVAKSNFGAKLNAVKQDFITTTIEKEYDYAIANYPFSLKPTDHQKEFIANDDFLRTFFAKKEKDINTLIEMETVVKPENVKGRLDFIFILKSFQHAQEGLYFAFPGIAYRGQEEKFRKYLIENKFIKEFGMIHNCKFEHTQISILFLHLTKKRNETTRSFSLDLKTDELLEEIATFENNQFNYPQKEMQKEFIDSVDLERRARENLIECVKQGLDFSQKVHDLDAEVRCKLPTLAEYKKQLIDIIEND